MSRTHYQIYQEQTFVLAKTLIVKHEEIASSMNTELYYRGYVIDSNPYNWRYYLNLSGEYHQADKDELYEKHGTEYIMVKLPSDAGPVDVPLTKELLHGDNADKAMMNEYQIGSKFYTELVSRYPDFESLIIGILNPIERGVAIKADNGEILFIAGRYKKMQGDRKWFDTTWYSINEVLIEPQEDNLILELQRYIYTFLKHWNNPEYIDGNDLYVVTMLGILYCNIPNAITNIRLGNCKTVRAHTFHIRQYLESHGQIGRYVDFIPIASSLWLYRNIEYLEANTGKQLTFNAILDNVLTPNEIPMSAYSVRHELSNMGDDKLLPTGMLYKETLNFEVVGASDDDRTVLDILEDQSGLARDNHLDLDNTAVHIQDTIDWGGDDRLNTKVLESEMMELGEPYPFTLSQFLFNMWGYTAIKGYYSASAFATNPLTGDRMSFSSRNAYILAHYCLNKGVAGVELTRIPKVRLYHIPKTNQTLDLPSDPIFKLKPDINKVMTWCVSDKTRRLKALEVVGTHIPNFYAQDAEAFFSHVHDIYDERIRRYNTYCDVEEVEERGDLELVAKRLYWMNFEETILDMSYEDWFRTVGFDPAQFDDNDLLNLGLELVASATGIVDQDNIRKKWLQKSLLAIMKHFISYTVHVIEKFADGVVAYLEGQTLRYSDFKFSYTGGLPVKYNLALDYKAHSLLKQSLRIDISNVFENTVVDIKAQVDAGYDLSNLEISQTAQKFNVGVYALSAEISNIEFNTDNAEPVFILVIDNVVNVITISGINAKISDSSWSLVVHTSNFGITLNRMSGRSTDTFIRLYGTDSGNHGTVIDGVYADVTDNVGKQDIRVDSSGLRPVGMFGHINDSILTDIGFIDDGGIRVLNTTGNSIDYVEATNQNSDINVVTTVDVSGSLSDDNVSANVIDNSIINLGVLEVALIDPQIPGVTVNADVTAGVIINIRGNSVDKVIDVYGVSDSSISLYDVKVTVLEDGVTVDMRYDDDVVTIGDITADMVDYGILNNVNRDNAAITIGDVDINVSDEALPIVTLDENVIDTNGITGVVNDTAEAIGTSNDGIRIEDITVTASDDSLTVDDTVDSDAVIVIPITGAVNDDIHVNTIIDTLSATISSITISARDSDMMTSTNDDDAIVAPDVNVIVHDDIDERYGSTDDSVMINNITGNVSDTNIIVRVIDDNVVGITNALLDVQRNDGEVMLTISDDDNRVTMDISDVIADATSFDVSSIQPADQHGLSVNAPMIQLTITGPNESYVMLHDDHASVVKPDFVTGSQRDTIITSSTVDSAVMTMNPDDIVVTREDTFTIPVFIDPTDVPNGGSMVVIDKIQISIKDESDDSNSQP